MIQKRKKQKVKKKNKDKKESVKQYKKERYVENRTSNVTNMKNKYQENPEVQLAHKKCNENPEIKKISKGNVPGKF